MDKREINWSEPEELSETMSELSKIHFAHAKWDKYQKES